MNKLINTKVIFGLVVLYFSFIFINCKKSETWPSIYMPDLKSKVEWKELSSTIEKNDKLECQVKEVEWGPEYLELSSFDPQGEVIYPGSIIDYSSFQDGTYKPIIGDRKPISLSISLSNISGISSQFIEEPSLSTTRNAISSILNTKSGGTGAQIFWKEHKIFSKKHFELEIGGNYGSAFGSISASFNFENTSVASRYLLEFTQVYYSIDVDLLNAGIQNYFDHVPTGLTSSLSPVIISSVKYGRKIFLSIESKEKSFDQGSTLVASFSSFWGSGGIKADQTLNDLLDEKAVKGMIIGGSASSAVPVVLDIKKLKDYLIDGANYSSTNIGVPLSYNLRFLQDNSVAKLVQYDKFIVRDCKIIPEETITIPTPSDLKQLCPNQVGAGDKEFNGHGPNIDFEVSVYTAGTNNDQLWYRVFFHLKETKSDFTEATGQWAKIIYTAPSNKRIEKIISENIIDSFEDQNTDLSRFPFSDKYVALLIEVQGDTDGNDVGNCTSDDSFISVYWNPIKITLKNR